MIVKKFKELYAVDQISQNKGWIKLHDALKQLDTDEDIQINFEGIKVMDPWSCPEFIEILKNPKIHMLFKNRDELVNRIKMTCILNGAYPDNIDNIEVEKPKEKTPEERKIEQYGEGLVKLFEPDTSREDTLIIDLRKKYTQLQNTSTLSYIKYAIDKLYEQTGKSRYVIIIGKMSILDNVLELFANIIIKYKSRGICVEIDLDNPDAVTKMGLYLHKETAKEFTVKERAIHIKKKVKNGLPGILIRYKKSKGLDDFGRFGKGEVVSSRIAIIRDVVVRPKDNKIVAMVESYNNDYFYTRQQWMVEHDNELLPSLNMDKLEIPLNELGFMDDFLGSSYHFLEPVPFDDTDNCKIIVAIDEDGRNVTRKCTLPERMKYVFDDWGIEYTVEDLRDFIERTKNVQANPSDIKVNKNSTSNSIEDTSENKNKGNIHAFEEALEKLEEIEDDLDNLDDIDDIDSEF